MKIGWHPSGLRQTKWYQYAVRFLIGGFITAATGVLAKEFGPAVGGLFLAFPAIFPASATLIEKHQREKKQRVGLKGEQRAREAAGIDAAGAAIGSIGLLLFATIVWQFIPAYPAWIVLITATGAWLSVSVLLWKIRFASREIAREAGLHISQTRRFH